MAISSGRLAVCVVVACVTVLFAPPSEAGSVSYTHDDAGRLVRADYGNGGVIEYTYDEAGNRLSRKVTRAEPGACAGDCNSSADVTVDELIQCVNIALGNQPVDSCRNCDTSGDSAVTVDELVSAVNAALNGCVRAG